MGSSSSTGRKLSVSNNSGHKNYVYIVRCSDGTYYTGWTTNLEARLETHNEGKGAKYTKGRRPVKIAYWEKYSTKEDAMKREYEIKKLKRIEKEVLLKKLERTI